MTIPIDCPKCGKKLKALDSLAGKKIQCPDCATRFAVEQPTTQMDSAPAEMEAPAQVTAETPALPQRTAKRERRWEPEDDEPNPFRRRNEGEEAVSTIIPYKNGMALASYYCGVFSLIPVLGLILGPLALILGILGFRFARRNPQAKGTAHAIVGIILGLMTTLGNWGPTLFVIALIIKQTMK